MIPPFRRKRWVRPVSDRPLVVRPWREYQVLAALAEETARLNDPHAAAVAMFAREDTDPHEH